jgi:hypothetical protein
MTAIIEMAIVIMLLIFMATQIALPLLGYGRFFWILREPEKKLAKLDKEIEEARLNKDVKEKYKQFKQKRREKNVSDI